MRVSCNGCRVLRKGCGADCTIRPCLQWIKSPQAQANATVFLAKFYGRAGLMNLIDAGPAHVRPGIFRSLLYEACGRMVNPIYGATGLLWSGSWHLCQAAVEAVLMGAPIVQVLAEAAETAPVPPLLRAASCDIRHVAKEDADVAAATGKHPHQADGVTRTLVKRSRNDCYSSAPDAGVKPAKAKRPCCAAGFHAAPSGVSSGSGASKPSSTIDLAVPCTGGGRENETVLSQETAEASVMTSHGSAKTAKADRHDVDDSEVELELTLGFRPLHHRHNPHSCSTGGGGGGSLHSRAHSPTWSSAGSVAAEAPENGDVGRMDCLGPSGIPTDDL